MADSMDERERAKAGFGATPVSASFHYGGERDVVAALNAPVAELKTPLAALDFAGEGDSGEHLEQKPEAVAVLVCHGMGQQVRFETVGQIAAAILNHAQADGCAIDPNGVQLSSNEQKFLARTELNWRRGGEAHQVHIYEAYWAPVTEGKVTYPETLQFLFQAAWRGFRCSKWFRKTTFDRWMFGDMQKVEISGWTKISLVLIALLLAVEAGSIAFVSLRVAAGIKEVSAATWPMMPKFVWLGRNHIWLSLWNAFVQLCVLLVRDVSELLKPFLPQHAALHHPWLDPRAFWIAVGKSLIWLAMIAQAFFVRWFLIEYAGDVAAYVSPFKDSKFDSIRTEIQKIGLDVARVIYGFDKVAGVPHYDRIVVAGHSLGSVLAYDTLNAIINLDNTTEPLRDRDAVGRTRHLVTFGSPLDKTAFLFRNQSNHVLDPVREQMAAGFQPLILSYKDFRPTTRWTNLWSPMDIISGHLSYYDTVPESDSRHVANLRDPDAWFPLKAHVQYWGGRLLAKTLYDAVK